MQQFLCGGRFGKWIMDRLLLKQHQKSSELTRLITLSVFVILKFHLVPLCAKHFKFSKFDHVNESLV